MSSKSRTSKTGRTTNIERPITSAEALRAAKILREFFNDKRSLSEAKAATKIITAYAMQRSREARAVS